MHVCDPGEVARELLPDYAWGPALAYFLRRFGPPNMASDPDREIACWLVTTPDPDVHVAWSAAPSDYVSARFRAFAPAERADELTLVATRDPENPGVESIRKAVARTLADLMRTVSVRDVDIDVTGAATRRWMHLRPSPLAGAALPAIAYHRDAFPLYAAIDAMGGAKGLRQTTALLRRTAGA